MTDEPQNTVDPQEDPEAPQTEARETEAEQPSGIEYIEFVGEKPHGTEFSGGHTITRKQLKDAWDVDTPNDLSWTKAEGGPNRGRFLVPVSDMSPAAAEGLAKEPTFRRVTLNS